MNVSLSHTSLPTEPENCDPRNQLGSMFRRNQHFRDDSTQRLQSTNVYSRPPTIADPAQQPIDEPSPILIDPGSQHQP